MKIKHSEPYGPLRAMAYPKIGEQLDAVMKLAAALRDQGIELPPETAQWVERCESVKRTFKKS